MLFAEPGQRWGAVGRHGDRIPYLPTCNWLARRCALEQVGGFQDGWRLGEDVDLCWRMADAGLRLFYFPGGAVAHDHRHRLPAFLGRKRDYARSEATLRNSHPDRFVARSGAWLRTLLVLCAGASVLSPAWGLMGLVGVLCAHILWRARRSRELAVAIAPGGLAWALARGEGARVLAESRAALRGTLFVWPPLLLLVPRLIPAALFIMALGTLGEWLARRPRLSPLEFAAGLALDSFAYSFGKLLGRIEGMFARSPNAG